jgi:release factor glutamine methyltransferase
VTAQARDWLAPGGVLLFETSDRQVPRAVDIVARDGLVPRVVTSEEMDATVIIGTRQAGGPQGGRLLG